MGAHPAWALLALTLPQADEAWLDGFARGFGALARQHNVALVGGNTTAGPLCISVQVLGHAPRPPAMLRAGGKPGDIVFVSGTPGDSAGGLALELGKLGAPAEIAHYLRQRFHFPTPRVELGLRLRDYAHACIDVSDGLLGDVGKLAEASRCGVSLAWEQLSVSPQLVAAVGDARARDVAEWRRGLRDLFRCGSGEGVADDERSPASDLGIHTDRRSHRDFWRSGHARWDCDGLLAFRLGPLRRVTSLAAWAASP